MLQRYNRLFNHHTVTTMLIRSSSQSLILRSFQTFMSPTTILQPQPQPQPQYVHAPRLNSSMFATAARDFHASRLNSVQEKKCTPSVMDKWEEMDVLPDVTDYIDGKYVKSSMSVRAYYSDISVNVKSLEKKYRDNYVGGNGACTYVVLRFGNTKPQTIGLGAITWSDDISYMVVFDYGSVILLNVRDPEISEHLKIVKDSNGKTSSPYPPDLDLIPENFHDVIIYDTCLSQSNEQTVWLMLYIITYITKNKSTVT